MAIMAIEQKLSESNNLTELRYTVEALFGWLQTLGQGLCWGLG